MAHYPPFIPCTEQKRQAFSPARCLCHGTIQVFNDFLDTVNCAFQVVNGLAHRFALFTVLERFRQIVAGFFFFVPDGFQIVPQFLQLGIYRINGLSALLIHGSFLSCPRNLRGGSMVIFA
nr:MAG TPA: hypothetical protein [Bacteriophage sp.]